MTGELPGPEPRDRPGERTAAAATGVVRLLTAAAQTLAVAESLTGGQLAAAVVDIPGASAVFRGGLVVYATDLKATLAGVPQDLLDARGPVDPDVASALAAGVRRVCRADWGVATTGVAGPDPHGGAPPGTAYVAVAGPAAAAVSTVIAPGGRDAVRRGTVLAALQLLTTHLSPRT